MSEMNKKLEELFPLNINYGIMKNNNDKYLKMGYKSLIVAVFPYFYLCENNEFSKYCRIKDYHTVVKEEFEKILVNVFDDFKIMTDISPFCEKEIAQEVGLGEIGENNLLLTKDYGSFVFIAEALVKEELNLVRNDKQHICLHCQKCKLACPSTALDNGFCKEKCLSYLTQKKNISDMETQLLKLSKYVFGCDICQLVCPVNNKAKETYIKDFMQPTLDLSIEKIMKLTADEFNEQYSDYAFCYKGLDILQRNAKEIYRIGKEKL